MIKAIIFDFFDVFRSDHYNNWLRKRGLEREGPYLAASEHHDRGEYSDKQFFQAISDASGEPVEDVESEMEAPAEFNQPLVDYLIELKGKYKTALLSNSSRHYLRAELAKYKLLPHFDEVVISSEVGLIKPEPEVFHYILQKLAVKPEECVFIDDNPKHVTAAEKLGIHGIIYTDIETLKTTVKELLDQI